MKRKVLGIVLATVLVLSLGLVFAAPVGAQHVCVETLYLSDTLGKTDGYSKLFEVVLDETSGRANLTPLPTVGYGPGIIPMEHADAIACTPDGKKIYAMQDNRDIGYYDLLSPSWNYLGTVTISGGADFLYIDRLAFAADGTLYFELNSGTTNALARITDLTTSPIVATVMGKVKDGGTELDIQGADIAFDAENICYLWHKKAAAPEGVYTFPQPTSIGDISATYLGPGATIADDYKVTGMAIRGCGMGDYPLLISDKTDPYGTIHEVDVVTGDMGNSYDMYEGTSPFDHGNGDMTVGVLGVPGPVDVSVDIKPTSCPNPLNLKSKGVLPVAILGTEDFDVTQIDPATVQLVGVPALRWNLEDVATPHVPSTDPWECDDCTTEGPDGEMDLTLKFNKQAIVAAIGAVDDGDCLVLTLTGELNDGTPISGVDVVRILKKGKK